MNTITSLVKSEGNTALCHFVLVAGQEQVEKQPKPINDNVKEQATSEVVDTGHNQVCILQYWD